MPLAMVHRSFVIPRNVATAVPVVVGLFLAKLMF